MLKRVLCLLLFSISLFAEEEIVVHLSSQEDLTPVSLLPFQNQNSGFDAAYLKKLEQVLRFDLDHNGHTTTTEKAAIKVKASVTDRTLTVSLTSNEVHKGMQGIPLKGNLSEDRKAIHYVADAIHEALFGTHGIAQSRILYTIRQRHAADSSKWVTEVWESDYDGENSKQLTHDGYLCVTPTFVPPSQGGRSNHFLYVSYKVGQPKIYASTLEKGAGQRLTYLRGNQLMPMLSPQRDKIAFICDVTGNPDLFIQDFSMEEGLIGKPRQIFCAPGATQGTPSFSPDGKQIAFVSNKDGTPRIYVITIPPIGTSIKEIKPLLISKQNRSNTCPAWSPDGTKIAYSATTQGVRQIWVYDFITGRETQLTDGYGHKENPVWAPNSLHLMFNSSTSKASELYLINLNQKKAVKITRGPGEKRFPAWEPLNL